MNALRMLVSPRIWLTVLGVVAVLTLVYVAYMVPVTSPEKNLNDLPIALVNGDKGAELAGENVDFGDRIVENATGPDSPASDTVAWSRPGSRAEALEGLRRKEYYGAIVIPADYSEQIAGIARPPEVPIAVVNEDAGAEMGGRPVNLGEEVAGRIISPDSPAPPFIEWTTLDDRGRALEGLELGDFYAAVVIPEEYSRTLASMSGSPSGTPAGMPTTAAAQPPAPEPASIQLLTSPAVRPSTRGLIENAFSGIVGGVSGATSGRILGGLSEAGAPVPQGAGPVISDPVRGEIAEADVPDGAGPLPVAPARAEIEVLTNPAAGQTAAGPAENISTGLVEAVSRATGERLSWAAGEKGAQLTPEVAAVLGDPVRADVTEAERVGPDSGNGQSPFFLAFLANLSGLMGAAVVFFAVRGAAEALAARGRRVSESGLWTMRLLVGFLYAALVAAAELWVAFGLLGVEHDAGSGQVWAFLALAVGATLAATMLLVAALGTAGIGVAAVLTVLLGLVSSGGNAPLEALPGFYRAYADWLPLRYVIDGLRSMLFYGGELGAARLEGGWRDSLWFLGGDGRSEAAGLEDAVWVLVAYLAGSAVLGYAVSLLRDLFAGRPKTGKAGEPIQAEVAG
jgi:YhgE/Pip-like protein